MMRTKDQCLDTACRCSKFSVPYKTVMAQYCNSTLKMNNEAFTINFGLGTLGSGRVEASAYHSYNIKPMTLQYISNSPNPQVR